LMSFTTTTVLLAAVSVARALLGFDISSPMSLGTAQCMKGQGYDFGIIHAWYCGSGTADPNAVTSYRSLRAAGIRHVGVYLYPCVGSHCPSAQAQVNSLHSFLAQNGMSPDSVWLDIESGGGCSWTLGASGNQAFYGELLSATKSYWPNNFGVYSSRYEWGNCFGSSYWVHPGDNDVKMWFADYDGVANFNNFLTFSAWTTPYAKQYLGDAHVCGFDVDLNWAPGFFGAGAPAPPPPPPGPGGSPPCTYSGSKGYCLATSTCQSMSNHRSVPSSIGANGCQSYAANVECCVAVAAPAPPPQAPACSFNDLNGVCVATSQCGGGHRSVSTAAGAKGCQAYAANVQCCVSATVTGPACTFGGANGRCLDTGTCRSVGGGSHASSAGAHGCEPYPANVLCCTGGMALLEDDLSGNDTASPALSRSSASAHYVALAATVAAVAGACM